MIKTGALISWSWANLIAGLRWLITWCLVQVIWLGGQFSPGRTYTIAFHPSRPAPWYLIWAVIRAGKGRISKTLHRADALFYFLDQTKTEDQSTPLDQSGHVPVRQINGGCTDISKTRVDQVFAQIFGYSLAIDPRSWRGDAVEKSDENGTHDGRVVQCPYPPKPGKVYQRLLVSSDNGATVIDYRSPTIGGQIPLVFIKKRPINQRFANHNTSVQLAEAKSIFSPDELLLLSQFCAAMGLDFGGLDVLRDREDGRIYVVDVNKTDMGPPIKLPFVQQFTAIRILAKTFRNFVLLGKPV